MADSQELLARLVEIDSVNPSLVAGGAGEAEVARFVAGWCERAGLEVEVAEVAHGRPNVIARARGRGGGRTLLLNAHTDTVGTAGMEAPLTPRVEGNRMYGRGAFDMKAGLAAAMLATVEAGGRGLAGDVVLTAVVDEEAYSIGSEAVAASIAADAAIVTEPTALELCVAHKGFVWLDVETTGRAAHGSRPLEGVDAIAAMGPVLVGIRELAAELPGRASHPLLGSGSIHASIIDGGRELSTYPERCLLKVERRTVPGETERSSEAELARYLDGRGTVRATYCREPFAISPDTPLVTGLSAAVERRLGAAPALRGGAGWTDAALLAGAGIPTVIFGPGGDGAHAPVEWVDLDLYRACVEILADFAVEFCA